MKSPLEAPEKQIAEETSAKPEKREAAAVIDTSKMSKGKREALELAEASRDPLGDWQVIVLSPFGSRLHLALRLALEARLRQRLGYAPQCLHHDDGILMRQADTGCGVIQALARLFELGVSLPNVRRTLPCVRHGRVES